MISPTTSIPKSAIAAGAQRSTGGWSAWITSLKTAIRVEIITANRGGPSLDWLNTDLGYITTPRARNKIKQWFRRRERDKSITAGKEVLDRELRKIGLASHLAR